MIYPTSYVMQSGLSLKIHKSLGLHLLLRTCICTKNDNNSETHWISTFPEFEETWSALQQTLEDRPPIAFSPDGRILTSGWYDKTVKLWDTSTGALQQTLKGHSGGVLSVAFSPDGWDSQALGFRNGRSAADLESWRRS